MRPTEGTSNTGMQSSAPASCAARVEVINHHVGEPTGGATGLARHVHDAPDGFAVSRGEPVVLGTIPKGIEAEAQRSAVEGLGLLDLGRHQL